MKPMRDLSLAPIVVALLGTPSTLAAETAGMQQHVSFASGGVGASSQEDLRARERDFNLKLLFTLMEGDYVADVNVVIRDAGGKIVLQHQPPAHSSWQDCRLATTRSPPTKAGHTRATSAWAAICAPSISGGRVTRRRILPFRVTAGLSPSLT